MLSSGLKLSILVFACIALSTAAPSPRSLKPLSPSDEYTHSLVVDEDEPNRYQIFWRLVGNDEYIEFELHCNTTGWVGFGLSPNGDMPGADIAIGWVENDSGKVHLRVCVLFLLLL